MERRRELRFAAVLAIAVAIVAGCSRDTPAPTEVATLQASGEPAPLVPAVTFFRPEAIASIRRFPEFGIVDGGGVDGDMQSYYFRTTDMNREFRRGFSEFVIPEFKNVFAAKVVLRETRGGTTFPLPPDLHELSFYTDVDRLVDTGDFDRATTALGTFETDVNEEQRKFEFDASSLVTRLRGAGLGIRVKLEADPNHAEMGFRGTDFSGSATPAAVRIEVTTTTIEANEHLQRWIVRMDLEPRLQARLLASLRRVGGILGDRDPGNDVSACDALTAFISEVASHEQDGLLLITDCLDLQELATNLKTAIGCP